MAKFYCALLFLLGFYLQFVQSTKVKRQTSPVVCSQPLYTGIVSETATPGTFILRVSAQDVNGVPLNFSIPDTSLQKFSVNPTTGDITVSTQLSRMFSRSALEFRVRASETTNSQNYCESTVRVNILPVTGSSSSTSIGTTGTTGSFGQSSYSFTLSSCISGTTVGQVFASSTNGGTNTYSISGGSSYYTINPSSGVITVLTPTTGTQTFTVTAISNTGTTSTVPVTVTSNCGSTGITTGGLTPGQSSYSFTLSTCTSGVPIGNVVAYSTTGGTVTYSLLSGSSYFTVNPTTGQIITLTIPPAGVQSLTVQAVSSSGQSAIIPVTVFSSCSGSTVGGFGYPTFSQSSYFFSATSCLPGLAIGQVFATASGASVTYQITGGNPYFSVNPTTGAITALTTPPSGTQSFTVQAFASSGQTVSVPVSISTTCLGIGVGIGTTGSIPAFFQTSYTLTATTCSVGSTVGSVTASSTFGALIYSIDGGNPYYAIAPTTGAITVISAPPSGTQTISVRAQANGYSAAVPVTITSSCSGTPGIGSPGIGTGTGGSTAVTFAQSSYFFPASSCVPGITVGQVTTTSSGGSVTYSLSGGNGAFVINPTTGQITTAGTQVSGTSTVTVTAQSSSGGTASTPVTITSTCNSGSGGSLTFGQSTYSFTATSCMAGSTVGQVSISSNPTGGSVTYMLIGNGGQYNINPTTGQIALASTLSSGQTTSLQIQATSSTGQSGQALVSISASCSGGMGGGGGGYGGGGGGVGGVTNRSPPIFTQSSYSCTVPCSSTDTQRACVISASNAAGDSINYIVTPSNQFYVDPNSGEIRTAIPLRTAGTYTLMATASDPYGTTSTAQVTITQANSC